MPKDFKVARLLDVYGALLSDKQRKITELYYNEDLSLSEISENEGITRQGAADAIKRAQAQLAEYEGKLGFCKKISALCAAAENGDIKTVKKIADEF